MTKPLDTKGIRFDDFQQCDPVAPPSAVYQRLRPAIVDDLNPSLRRVAARVATIHLVTAAASLLVCPQFGVGPFGGDAGLMKILMQWGWAACAAGCGATFMLGTGIASALVLSPDEKRVLDSRSGWLFTSLAATSWAVLMMMAAVFSGDAGHGGHHAATSSSPEAFSTAWSLIWALAATAAAWLSHRGLRALRVGH